MTSTQPMPDRKKRLPKWIKITLAVFGVLFVLSAIFGKSPEQEPTRTIAAPAGTTTPSPTLPSTSSAPADEFTVTSLLDAETVTMADSTGATKTVRVAGIKAPKAVANGCFGTESAAWATNFLIGKQVRLATDAATTALDQSGFTVAALTLADGTDYATAALRAGYARYLADGVTYSVGTALQTAENLAHSVGSGLWGAPCFGTIDAPVAVRTPAPQAPVVQAPVVQAAPEPAPTKAKAPAKQAVPTPAPEVNSADTGGSSSAYYKNCDAARAAGAAPLHVGDPGYSRKLDRDGDGVACE